MGKNVVRFSIVCAAVAAFCVYLNISNRAPAASGAGVQHKLTPDVRARGLTFAADVPQSDRAWVLAAIAKTRPEAQALIGAVDGLVTISVRLEPDAPWVGMADPATDDVTLNTYVLDGERKQDRDAVVIHELGHIVDFELVPDDQMTKMADEVPSEGGCVTPERGDCAAPEERFADTFAKWALNGAVSRVGAGYNLMSPASLETWGEPLGLIAAQISQS